MPSCFSTAATCATVFSKPSSPNSRSSSFSNCSPSSARRLAGRSLCRAGKSTVSSRASRGADPMHVGSDLEVKAQVEPGGFSPEDVEVRLFHGPVDSLGDIPRPQTVPMSANGAPREGNTWVFTGTLPCRSGGQHGFAVRVLPRHGDLANPFEPGLVCWG